MSKGQFITLKEHFEKLIKNLAEKYDQRFKDSEAAVRAAFAAQEKAVETAFGASEKASAKAEEAQSDYNVLHNDLLRKMDEQNKTQMPRLEILGIFKAGEEKYSALQKQVDELRLSKATLEGKASQQSVNVTFLISCIGIVLGIVGIILKFLE